MGPPATAGETAFNVSVTVPGNPPRLVRVIVEVPDAPAGKVDGVTRLAEILKSDKATMKVTACDTRGEPPVPVTVKV